MNKRVEFKFYLDIEGETEEQIKNGVRYTVELIQNMEELEDYEPLIEPYQWRNLENDGDYSYINNAIFL